MGLLLLKFTGLSTKPSVLFHSIPGMARDVWDLVDVLGWDNVHIVSVSMGGMISLEMVSQRPER